MRKLSETMQYITPRKDFVAENKQSKTQTQPETELSTSTQIHENAQSQSETIPPCPKSLELSPSDLLDEDEKVLKFDAFVNECLNKKNKGQHKWIGQVRT